MAKSAISSKTLPAIPQQPTAADMSAPGIKPGYRLVPARIGNRDSAGTAWIECPVWCVEDHTAEPNYLEDVVHTSASEDVGISSFLKRDGSLLMYAMLQADPESPDERLQQAHIAVEHEGVPDYLTPEMAEAFADDLVAFAAQVRHMARAARRHNQVQGGAL